MLKFRQISFRDPTPPISDDWIGVLDQTPERLAEILHAEAERSFDDLDYFSFFGLEVDGLRLGFMRHRGIKERQSVITVPQGSKPAFRDVQRVCVSLFGIDPGDVKPRSSVELS